MKSFQDWSAMESEGRAKVKVFSLTAMHQKIPTAETLAARGIQTSPSCALCNSGAEDAHHLLTDCSFSKQVIHFIWPWYSLDGGPTQVSQEQGMAAWLSTNVARANARNHRETIGILLYYVERMERTKQACFRGEVSQQQQQNS
jgi:hypothetical protein